MVAVRTSQVPLVVKNPPANPGGVKDAGSAPGLGRSPGGGPGHSLQYSCLENPTQEEPGYTCKPSSDWFVMR